MMEVVVTTEAISRAKFHPSIHVFISKMSTWCKSQCNWEC